MADQTGSESTLRRAILDSARAVVVEEGYAALTMRRVARMIGYSATSIYLHFESKDSLLHALIEEGMDALHARLSAASKCAATPVDAVRDVCAEYVAFGLESPEYYEIMFMLHPHRMERFPAEKYRRARKNLEVIAEAIDLARQGRDASGEPALLEASVVWAQLHGAVSLMIARRIDIAFDVEAFSERIIDRTLTGLGLAATAEVER